MIEFNGISVSDRVQLILFLTLIFSPIAIMMVLTFSGILPEKMCDWRGGTYMVPVSKESGKVVGTGTCEFGEIEWKAK
jgi:hypothetical protein